MLEFTVNSLSIKNSGNAKGSVPRSFRIQDSLAGGSSRGGKTSPGGGGGAPLLGAVAAVNSAGWIRSNDKEYCRSAWVSYEASEIEGRITSGATPRA